RGMSEVDQGENQKGSFGRGEQHTGTSDGTTAMAKPASALVVCSETKDVAVSRVLTVSGLVTPGQGVLRFVIDITGACMGIPIAGYIFSRTQDSATRPFVAVVNYRSGYVPAVFISIESHPFAGGILLDFRM